MRDDDLREAADGPTDSSQSEAEQVSRRKALGRFAAYTAPVTLALLASAEHASAS